jgi:MoCo/4Fe-4S cofactor protein with predicted Tat translocation signal
MTDKMGNSNVPKQWLNSEELAAHEDFEAHLNEHFPKQAAIMRQYGMDRRTFLKVMGASLTMAGFGLQGCTTAQEPSEQIIPYVRMPEEIIPGEPLFYTTTMTLGGYATGVLIETHEARPHRLEGNPQHPASMGGADVRLMSSILELYNPDRSVFVRNDGEVSSWEDYLSALRATLDRIGGDGSGIRILTETVSSPTLISQIDSLLEQFPGAQWHQYEPVNRDNVIAGSEIAFGEVVETQYRFDNAGVVLALDVNFLSELPGSLRYARDFMDGRRVRAENADSASATMSRLYAVEGTPTITGSTADHRLKLRSSEVDGFVRALASALGLDVDAPAEGSWDAAWLDALVSDLQEAGENGLVVVGPNQPAAVHAMVHAINAELGAAGNTVIYTEPVTANPGSQIEDLTTLVDDMSAGDVRALFIMGGNPVYTAPADLNFADALDNVVFATHLSLYFDETSARCAWHIPQTHYVEEWSDARAYDGTASIVQPPIGPLLDTVRSSHELVAAILGDDRDAYDILRENWEANYNGDVNFDTYWTRSLHNGVLEGTAFDTVEPSLSGDALAQDAPAAIDGIEVVFQPDPAIYDGRFANNAWLQELPNPLTKVTWDNTAVMSPATAVRLGLLNEDVVEIELGGNTMAAPVWVDSNQVDGAITVYLGYGRGLSGDVGSGYDFNAYQIRTAAAPCFAGGAEVTRIARDYPIAITQATMEVERVDYMRRATLDTFNENPAFVYAEEDAPPFKSILDEYPYSDEYAWSMSIDQTACIGCNACIIACQAENNINTVGKDQVRVGREMHWIRVDRNDDSDLGRTDFQPVPCMHCEKAPCEQVCPVQATVHSNDGLNQMVYNRCVGTRYCAANCPYGVRRFNFLNYVDDAPIMVEVRNPDVSVRERGIMEKCSYCVQRINEGYSSAIKEDRQVRDGEVTPACASSCPTQAIVFGNQADASSRVAMLKAQPHNYGLLEDHNTQPRTTYLGKVFNPNSAIFVANEEPAVSEEE